jgi:hypothetical protein
MKLGALALVALVAGCTPLESIDRFDGEFGAAKEKRRVLALASPT